MGERSPADSEPASIVYRVAALDEILDLREAVIIRGTGRTSREFPGDHDATTYHFGAFEHGRNVCCATFLRSEWQKEPAWQLRGMATAPEFRRRGIGAALLAFAEDTLRVSSPIRQLWCNAREVAYHFYHDQGWLDASEDFPTPGIGIQRKLIKRL